MLQQGQVWQFNDSFIQIGIVGRTLVHYKHFRGNAKRAGNLLMVITAMEKHLAENRAVLQKPTAR